MPLNKALDMRITIGLKIFAVAGAVILLMSGAAAWTTLKIRDVTDQVDAVALYLLPLNNSFASMQANLLRQEIVLQQILNDIDRDAPEQTIQTHITTFKDLGAQADAEIENASTKTDAALSTLGKEQAVELSRLITQVQNIATQHQDIQDLVVRAIDAHLAGSDEAATALIESFTQAQLRFDETVEMIASQTVSLSSAAMSKAESEEHVVLQFSIGLTVLAVVLGLLFALQFSRSLVRPVQVLRDRTRAVEVGDLSQDIPVTTSDEIADLSRSFNNMLEGLRSKERMQSMFGQYVDPRVVETMLADDNAETSLVDGDKKTVTVFFSDIVGFTQMGERLSPIGLVRLINEYLSLASDPIVQSDGVIDKYIGDMIMAFWSPPFVSEGEQARLACGAALAQFEQLEVLRKRLPDITGLRRDLPDVAIRVGLASGDAVVGSIGSEHAKNFTVMGDTVNLGSRLESANKVYGTRILICDQTRASAGNAIEVREIDSIAVHGKTEPLRVFELLAHTGALSETDVLARDDFETGLAAYRAQNWQSAEEAFAACLQKWPDDPPAKLFLDRITRLRQNPPGDAWDTVWQLTQK